MIFQRIFNQVFLQTESEYDESWEIPPVCVITVTLQ